MHLIHKVVPFSTSYLVIIVTGQSLVVIKTFVHLICPFVGTDRISLYHITVHSQGVIHIIEVVQCGYREGNDLVVCVMQFPWHLFPQRHRVLIEPVVFLHPLFPFSVLKIECIGV